MAVCCDGNVEQQRLRHAGSGDQPVPKVHTHFLTAELVEESRDYVNAKMGKSSHKAKAKDNDEGEPDDVVPGLTIPNHVYSGCKKRFLAADEDNKKADTSVFSDTGLMALVCRHDRVLFMANQKDAGEKRFYAIALIKQLFEELPSTWRVGTLYDIGCQVHRTMLKVSQATFSRMQLCTESTASL